MLNVRAFIAAPILMMPAACADRAIPAREDGLLLSEKAEPQEPAAAGQAQASVVDRVSAFRHSAGDTIFFIRGSYSLSFDARLRLGRQAVSIMTEGWLQHDPGVTLRVEGNSDPAERATADEALALGVRRAIAAKDYLVALGVPADRIVIQSNGRDRLRDPRAVPEAHAVNRNVLTIIVDGFDIR
jgi:peptidoglycan-associated lipoprotein